MMIKELDYIIIEYNEAASKYIKLLSSKIDIGSKEIVSFFELKEFDQKVHLKILNSQEELAKECKNKNSNLSTQSDRQEGLSEWDNNNIYILSLENYKTVPGHEEVTLDDLLRVILYRFALLCFRIRSKVPSFCWLEEGLAMALSHQYDDSKVKLDASIDEIVFGTDKVYNYYAMFKYVLDTYGPNYILYLIDDYSALENDTPNLYEAAYEMYNETSDKEEDN